MQNDTVKVLLFFVQWFEYLKAVAILNVFAWTHYREHIRKATVTTAGFHEFVTSRCGLSIRPDLLFVKSEDFCLLISRIKCPLISV